MSKDSLEAALADEEHEPQKVQRHERGRCQGVDAPNTDLFGEGTRKKPHVVQGIYDATEEAVDKDRVDAAVARGLGTLDHHEHDDHAVDRVENRGLPSGVLKRREGQKEERRDHEGERHAVEPDDVEPHALHLPQREHGDGADERSGHGKHVHERPDLGLADRERAHDAGAKADGPDAEGASPVVADHGAIHRRVLVWHVLEHRLVKVDLAAFQHDGQAEQRHEDQGDEKRGHRLGNSVKPEVHDGAVHRSSDEVEVPPIGVRAREQALPQHVEACRPESQKRTTNDDERKGDSVEVDRGDKAAPSQKVGDAGKPHEKTARRPRQEIHAHRACEIAQREHERLGEEEPEDDFRRLKIQGKEREHAAPNARGIDREEERVSQRGHVRACKICQRGSGHVPPRVTPRLSFWCRDVCRWRCELLQYSNRGGNIGPQ